MGVYFLSAAICTDLYHRQVLPAPDNHWLQALKRISWWVRNWDLEQGFLHWRKHSSKHCSFSSRCLPLCLALRFSTNCCCSGENSVMLQISTTQTLTWLLMVEDRFPFLLFLFTFLFWPREGYYPIYHLMTFW